MGCGLSNRDRSEQMLDIIIEQTKIREYDILVEK